MRYLSVCSGIEAASVAWHRLSWEPVAFSEIEPFPCAVLKQRWPGVPNWGDVERWRDWPDADIDLLVGGTPCQSFSVAGLRKGLADPRGNLALTYLAIADCYRPRWILWENVPGVLSSNGGRDFGALVGAMVELGYGVFWRVLDAQYVRVDGYPRAVPQRRRRVFVVGYLGDWRRAAAVLLEPESLPGNPPPRREAGKGVAPTISARPTGGGGLGTDFDCDGGLVVDDAARCDTAGYAQRLDWETENFIATRDVADTLTSNGDAHSGFRDENGLVAHSLRAEGFDASEDGTGRGTPIVPVPYTLAIRGRDGEPDLEYRQDGTANAILTPNGGRGGIGVGAIALDLRNALRDPDKIDEVNRQGCGIGDDVAHTLSAGAEHGVCHGWAVRRLTPRECERLQGFPDDYTAIRFRGKPAADGPRYRALGNSMAVNCMRWIGRRIEMVEALAAELDAGRAA